LFRKRRLVVLPALFPDELGRRRANKTIIAEYGPDLVLGRQVADTSNENIRIM